MSDETLRYLISYLEDNQNNFLEWFECRDDHYIDYNKLEATIKQFFETLP